MNKYEYIAQDLINRIDNKEFDKKLPTEEKLIEYYNVSRNTIRHALHLLVKKDIIYLIQGSGIFIRPQKKENTVSLSKTLGITSDNSKDIIFTKVLKLETIESDERLSQLFECEIGTPIYYIKRLRYKNNVPYAIEYTYYNKTIIPFLCKEIAENSIFKYIKEDLGIAFGFADKYLDVVKLSKKDAELLQLEENDPALKIEDHIYTTSGLIFNVSNVYYNYHLSHFYISSM